MLRSTIALADSSGIIQTQYSYDPFGNVTVSGASRANPYQFTGRENDGTGLYYYRARYYSPALQRFISADPAETEPSYVYSGDDPVMYGDPSGDYATTPIPLPYLISEVETVVYKETALLYRPQPNLVYGRADVASAIFNGVELFGQHLCDSWGYVYMDTPCAPPSASQMSTGEYQDSVAATMLSVIGLLQFPQLNLRSLQYYSMGAAFTIGSVRGNGPDDRRPTNKNDWEYLSFQEGPFDAGPSKKQVRYFSFWSNTCNDYTKYDGVGYYYPNACQGKH